MSYGKLINGRLIEAPNVLVKDGKQYINPPEWLYTEYGFFPMEYTTIPDMAEGYHLVQSWIVVDNKLLQKWNYEANTELTSSEEVKILREKVVKFENPQLGTVKNPIPYIQGMEIEDKKWYSNGTVAVKAIMGGTPKNFNDINYFG